MGLALTCAHNKKQNGLRTATITKRSILVLSISVLSMELTNLTAGDYTPESAQCNDPAFHDEDKCRAELTCRPVADSFTCEK